MDLRSAAVERLERPAPPTEPSLKGSTQEEAPICCPWCEALNVERVGAIGSHLMVSQYICLVCRSPFEVLRR